MKTGSVIIKADGTATLVWDGNEKQFDCLSRLTVYCKENGITVRTFYSE